MYKNGQVSMDRRAGDLGRSPMPGEPSPHRRTPLPTVPLAAPLSMHA